MLKKASKIAGEHQLAPVCHKMTGFGNGIFTVMREP
jgi:hypothetical protein